MSHAFHKPVLLNEMLQYLSPRDGEIYLDGTFGAGGYTRAILEAADCKVIAIDRDPVAEAQARNLQDEFRGRFEFVPGCYGEARSLLPSVQLDGMVLDIGVSSMQIDEGGRGFSFQKDGPLDMRMSQSGPTLAERLAEVEEEALADILYHYGEERKSRRISRFIIEARAKEAILTTRQLAEIVRRAIPAHGAAIDPATRTFQALRIWMNQELEELENGLAAALHLLKAGGRLVVVVFHSLEDRIVKRFLQEHAGEKEAVSRHIPITNEQAEAPLFTLLTKKPVMGTDAEIAGNPRARSAKLRAAVRTDAPVRARAA